MNRRLVSTRLRFVSNALLAALVACSHAAEPQAPAPTTQAEPAPDLGDLFARAQYEAIVAAAPEQLQAARERGATPVECWEIEHVFLLALAHTPEDERLVECWRADSLEFADVIPPDFLFELGWHIPSPDGRVLKARLVAASSDPVRNRALEFARRADDPYGHREGFPRAWLAPDERPPELDVDVLDQR